jgi:sialate O-acetylesterase
MKEKILFDIKVCCDNKSVCMSNDTVWQAAPASRIEGVSLTISLAVPSQCISKPINGIRYLWKETPCLFKEAAVYNGEDSDIPAPPYIQYF